MTERIQAMRRFFVTEKGHKQVRRPAEDPQALARDFAREGVRDVDRAARRLIAVLQAETPVVYPEERIAFTRTVTTIPELFTPEEMEALKRDHWIHEHGEVCNINVNYTLLLGCGFDEKRRRLKDQAARRRAAGEEDQAHYLERQESILAALQDLADRYQAKAQETGNDVVARTLSWVPAHAPRTWLEALQMFRILHFALWCGGNYHNTVGRFDQYMSPYFRRDMDRGLYTAESALELLEEFFLTFNRDSDLYPGIQQGDNGQSMVLGGRNLDGSDSFNALSALCLKASLELKLIDPKINVRVHKDTPMETYVLGTELTKQGLGFPQYSNDDVVIPGLLDLGYAPEDAYNYVVAACWEFIIPGAGMDVPNIEAFSFARAVEEAVLEDLPRCGSYDDFTEAVRRRMQDQADGLCRRVKNLYMFPAPFVSLMMDGCEERARDVSLGCKYNNYGFHGTGLSTAADSMEAVKRYVFDEKTLSPETLIDALRKDFVGYETLCNKLRYDTPKMGNNNDEVDSIAVGLLDAFADCLKGRVNDRGGIFRAGTGSAMYYIWHAREIPATPDGRRAGENLAANYSPSLFSHCAGPVSILRSFAKPHLQRVINGGPLTLELHDTVFRTAEAVRKVATLVKSFMDLGGHQLQLNSVNRETMLDAQKHPENYRNLIVRVWGWSGYFVELDKEYQDHIIQRMELSL